MTLRKSSPPIVPRRAEAPITATELGLKNDPSDAETAEWSRSRHAVEHLGGCLEGELDLDDAADVAAANLEAGVAEHAQHRCVLGQDLGDEPVDAGVTRVRGQPLEQTARDAPALELVGDDEGDLGTRRIPEPNPRPQADHAHGAVAVDQFADQRQALVAVAAQERPDQVRVDADRALEAQVAALRRQALEEVEQRPFVGGGGRSQAQRRAVPQDDVFPIGDRNHAATVAEPGRRAIRRGPCK